MSVKLISIRSIYILNYSECYGVYENFKSSKIYFDSKLMSNNFIDCGLVIIKALKV